MSRLAVFGLAVSGLALWTGCTETKRVEPVAPTNEAKVIVCAPGSFQSGNECLPVKLECPPDTVPDNGQCVAPVVTAQEVLDSKPTNSVATGDSYEDIVDPRVGRRTPRSRQLLITELQGLESLYASIPKNGPDRPKLMRRLAEGYVELEAAALRDSKQASAADERAKGAKIEQAARMAAIKYYTVLLKEYPQFCGSPNAANPSKSTGCADEVHYYVGLEYVRAQQLDQARKTFLKLIQSYPQSTFVPHTYFQFGEMFRKEGAGDPAKYPLAEQSYLEALKYPGPMMDPSRARLAQVYEAEGKPERARAIRAKMGNPNMAVPDDANP